MRRGRAVELTAALSRGRYSRLDPGDFSKHE